MEKKDYQFADLLIILSISFHYKKDNDKIYLCEKMKEHNYYKEIAFWESSIPDESILK